jgi:uncharacterized membrane protein
LRNTFLKVAGCLYLSTGVSWGVVSEAEARELMRADADAGSPAPADLEEHVPQGAASQQETGPVCRGQ